MSRLFQGEELFTAALLSWAFGQYRCSINAKKKVLKFSRCCAQSHIIPVHRSKFESNTAGWQTLFGPKQLQDAGKGLSSAGSEDCIVVTPVILLSEWLEGVYCALTVWTLVMNVLEVLQAERDYTAAANTAVRKRRKGHRSIWGD